VARNVRLSHGIHIGHGCIIAEGSLIKKDCDPYGFYGGTPARLIKYRFPPHIIEQVLEIRWWDWSEEKIQRNQRFFDQNLTKVDNIQSLIRG
jgi:virginiamycin A acetyltransferase|tara:strand:+ start:4381 stop:4656 length:276 start_codon:yes stop_codon:yes gene_type:complete